MFDLLRSYESSFPGMPRYRALASCLRQGILSGQLSDGLRLPPEAKLSAELGINNRTLRSSLKLLAEEHLISQCRGKGTFITYKPPVSAKILVLLGDGRYLNDDFYILRMMAGLSLAQKRQGGVELQFIATPSLENLYGDIQSSGCDALLVIERSDEVRDRLCSDEFGHLPMVFINPSHRIPVSENRCEVSNASGGTLAGVRLLHEMGHRKIGFISISMEGDERILHHEQEFKQACRELKITSKYARTFPFGELWYDGARRTAVSLFSKKDRPTALLCPGFVFSCGAWQGLMDVGLRVPEDVSMLGFDTNTAVNPHLSSMDAPLTELASAAVELCLAMQMEGKHRKELSSTYSRCYVDRGSCRSIVE